MTSPAIVLFSGPFDTSFSQVYIESADMYTELLEQDPFEGQTNQLCGGAVPGGLFVRVGVHTGELQLTIELHESAPPVDLSWDEIAEVSFVLNDGPMSLAGWGGESYAELPGVEPGVYRARYYAKAFGQLEWHQIEAEVSGERYAVLLWPEAWRPDELLKSTLGDSLGRPKVSTALPSAKMQEALGMGRPKDRTALPTAEMQEALEEARLARLFGP
jgi:hypothetical protein